MRATTLPTRVGEMTHRIRLSMRRGAFPRGRGEDPGIRLVVRNVDTDEVLAVETIWCGSRWDPSARNRLGGLGAFATVWPGPETIAAAALRLMAQYGVTEQRDRRLYACGVPLLDHTATVQGGAR